jgi:hypothetical protein
MKGSTYSTAEDMESGLDAGDVILGDRQLILPQDPALKGQWERLPNELFDTDLRVRRFRWTTATSGRDWSKLGASVRVFPTYEMARTASGQHNKQ